MLLNNKQAKVSISQSTSIPVLKNREIINYLLAYEAKSDILNIGKVKQSIAGLEFPLLVTKKGYQTS